MSDYKGAEILLDELPRGKFMLADRGYDTFWFRDGLKRKSIKPCIPAKKNKKTDIPHDKTLHKQRHKIENMFDRLKDWRRITTRYDRYAHTFSRPFASQLSLYGGFNES